MTLRIQCVRIVQFLALVVACKQRFECPLTAATAPGCPAHVGEALPRDSPCLELRYTCTSQRTQSHILHEVLS